MKVAVEFYSKTTPSASAGADLIRDLLPRATTVFDGIGVAATIEEIKAFKDAVDARLRKIEEDQCEASSLTGAEALRCELRSAIFGADEAPFAAIATRFDEVSETSLATLLQDAKKKAEALLGQSREAVEEKTGWARRTSVIATKLSLYFGDLLAAMGVPRRTSPRGLGWR